MRLICDASCQARVAGPATELLAAAGLKFDRTADQTIVLLDGERAVATGSRKGRVLKCIAVDPNARSQGLVNQLVSELSAEGARAGQTHLFLFTRPHNRQIFSSLGFYQIAATDQVVLLENRRHGMADYLASLDVPTTEGRVGAVVMHCDPFTNGHLYLVTEAAKECDLVHVFVVSEADGMFDPAARLGFARAALAGMPGVVVHPTGDYLVSYVTFPDYFLRREARRSNSLLDLTIFAERIAAPLHIGVRFVGTESGALMKDYNATMADFLPTRGVEVRELARLCHDGEAVSASRVRSYLRRHDLGASQPLLPPAVFTLTADLARNDANV